ncbi:MAG: polymer-forming cytoskeletal protein [Proteobacteria bacterium]|nr:polymer-forming cytoskeletal protein [Pseudomonadota bacterium]
MNDSLPRGPADPAQGTAPRPTLIGGNLRVRGTLESTGAVQIEGTVDGDVRVASIVVGVKGSVTGNVVADTIDVHGFVRGNIEARIVELEATAHVVGDTTHQVLRVERGACLDGNYRTMGKSREGPAAAAPEGAPKGRGPGP